MERKQLQRPVISTFGKMIVKIFGNMLDPSKNDYTPEN